LFSGQSSTVEDFPAAFAGKGALVGHEIRHADFFHEGQEFIPGDCHFLHADPGRQRPQVGDILQWPVAGENDLTLKNNNTLSRVNPVSDNPSLLAPLVFLAPQGGAHQAMFVRSRKICSTSSMTCLKWFSMELNSPLDP
jgi:hypothetical protein